MILARRGVGRVARRLMMVVGGDASAFCKMPDI